MALINLEITNLLMVIKLNPSCKSLAVNVSNFPLTWYRNEPFYILRTDALDRFGTRLEQRFTKEEITQMLMDAGFKDFKFSDREPFWTVLAYKK